MIYRFVIIEMLTNSPNFNNLRLFDYIDEIILKLKIWKTL